MWKVLRSSLFVVALVTPTIVGAQGVVQLTGISFGSNGTGTVAGYVQALYFLAIGIGAALAVLRLILAGAKYMLTDVVTQKGEAKKDVYAGVVGLLIILAAVLILETINPQLNNLDVLNLQTVNRPAPAGDPGLGERFEARAGENVDTFACSADELGNLDCDAARERCRNSGDVVGEPTVHQNTVYCYTRDETVATGCDGYRAPDGTCYGSTIELGDDFADMRGDLRAQECTRIAIAQGLNAQYDNVRGVCEIVN
jgi:hypothetical protein